MQFLLVKRKPDGLDTEVLIDEENNGSAGKIIMLDEGTYDVSLDESGATTKTIDLEDTTMDSPMEVEIEVEAPDEKKI